MKPTIDPNGAPVDVGCSPHRAAAAVAAAMPTPAGAAAV